MIAITKMNHPEDIEMGMNELVQQNYYFYQQSQQLKPQAENKKLKPRPEMHKLNVTFTIKCLIFNFLKKLNGKKILKIDRHLLEILCGRIPF